MTQGRDRLKGKRDRFKDLSDSNQAKTADEAYMIFIAEEIARKDHALKKQEEKQDERS